MLWSVPLDGSPLPLVRFDAANTTFGRGAFQAQGSTPYFTQLTSESDVWVVETTLGRRP